MISVVDENVLIVANDLSRRSQGIAPQCPQATEACGERAAETLMNIITKGRIGLDDGSEVLEKYGAHCDFSGQPGIGDLFLRSVYQRGYDSQWAIRVPVRNGEDYALPQEFVASGFDNDDFLWVAIAYNAPAEAEIVNAVDSDYTEFTDAFDAIGVSVREICP